jgi:hypothetical protein
MCRGVGCAGSYEARYPTGSGDGDRLRDQGCPKWEVDPERNASKFDAAYYRGLVQKAWGEAAFVFTQMARNKATR